MNVTGGKGKTYFIPVGIDFLTFEVSETSVFSHDCKNLFIRQLLFTVELTLFGIKEKFDDLTLVLVEEYEEKFQSQIFFFQLARRF